MLFDKIICWNIFDHANNPEPYFALLHRRNYKEARSAARKMTLRHPVLMIPVIIDCLKERKRQTHCRKRAMNKLVLTVDVDVKGLEDAMQQFALLGDQAKALTQTVKELAEAAEVMKRNNQPGGGNPTNNAT